MKKKICAFLAACLLLAACAVPVSAAPNDNVLAQMISGYCLGNEMYAFIRMNDGYDVDSFKLTLQSDAASSAQEAKITPITETSSIVRYVFMIDRTGSMRKYTEKVNTFLDALTNAEKQNAFFTIATFGERFEVVSENLTDKNAVKNVLEKLEYTEKLTDPYTGVESAIKYLDSYSRRSGDIINLIVITDGEPDFGLDSEKETLARGQELAASLTETIKQTPEIILSTLCTAEWDATAFGALSNGNGIHEQIGDDGDAAAAGQKMAEYVDSLYRTSFMLDKEPTAERFAVQIKMRGMDLQGTLAMFDIDIENLPNLKLFSNETQTQPSDGDAAGTPSGDGQGGVDIGGTVEQPSSDGNDPQNTESTEEPAGAGDNGTEGQEGSEDGKDDSGDASKEDSDSKDKDDDSGDTDGGNGFLGGMNPFLLVIPAACVVIVAIICMTILLRKKKTDAAVAAPQTAAPPISGGIAMRLEVIAGTCATSATTLYLAGELVIGSGEGCDLRFIDAQVAPRHARIVMRNNMIYLEDLDSPTGTFLGGMRIQGQNRLRSGDAVSVGDCEFSLKF